jgi:hypothetical protein
MSVILNAVCLPSLQPPAGARLSAACGRDLSQQQGVQPVESKSKYDDARLLSEYSSYYNYSADNSTGITASSQLIVLSLCGAGSTFQCY